MSSHRPVNPEGTSSRRRTRAGKGRCVRPSRALLPLAAAALLAGGVGALVWWSHGKFERSLVSSFQRYQLTAAHSVAGAMEDVFADVEQNVRTMATHPKLVARDLAAAGVLQNYYRAHADVVSEVGLADAEGRVLFRAPESASSGNVGEWPEFIWTRESGKPYAGNAPAFAPGEGERVVRVVSPLETDGRFGGAVYAVVSVRKLSTKSFSRPDRTPESGCWVISSGGEVLFATDEEYFHRAADHHVPGVRNGKLEQEMVRTVAVRCAGKGREGVTQMSGSGSAVLLSYAPIQLGGHRYALAMAAPKSDISVPITAHERVTYSLIAVLVVMFFAAGYVSYRSARAHLSLAEQRRRVAESASRAKSDFLAKVSHEIRNPMSVITGMTEHLLDSELQPPQRRYLHMVRQASDWLLTVINDILDFSKIEAGRLELVCSDFSLRDCVRDTSELMGVRAQEKGLSLRFEVEADVPDALVGDPGRLRQILINLLGNAVKFTDAGEVGVRVALEADEQDAAVLHFVVTDTGPGIPPEKRQEIFNAFSQGGTYRRERHSGTGLGLAISAQLVELMGGRIWADSEVGEGSAFHFLVRLPRSDLQTGDGKDVSVERLRGLRALVVDSEAVNRDYLQRVLTDWGVESVACPGGPAGMEALRRAKAAGRPFGVAIVEAAADGVDGFSLARELSFDKDLSDTPVILMSRMGVRGDGARSQAAGAIAYLTKPIGRPVLAVALSAAMDAAAGKAPPRLITRHSLRESRRQLHILLAEDNPVNREHVSLLLEKWGHQVVQAPDGRAAVDACEQGEFDLILMDAEMPEMNGLEAAAEIRRREADTDRHLPIIAMTAHALKGDRERCLAAGMDDYITKPMERETLFSLIEALTSGGAPEVREVEPVHDGEAEPPPAGPPGEPAEDGDRPSFDKALALQRVGGRESTLCRLATVFLQNRDAMLSGVRDAIDAGDGESLRKAAHRLKGSLALLAAGPAHDAAYRLELAGREGRLEDAEPTWEVLQREVSRLSSELAPYGKEATHATDTGGR
jgi:signal transduction histidine kinase/DNA-binding response OmpR family regulator/HPt (histidine-containing phosphotransfer) domain-containing protein